VLEVFLGGCFVSISIAYSKPTKSTDPLEGWAVYKFSSCDGDGALSLLVTDGRQVVGRSVHQSVMQ